MGAVPGAGAASPGNVREERLRSLWRLGTGVFLLVFLGAILYIAAGGGDPKPLGVRQETLHPAPLTLPPATSARQRQLRWLETAVSPPATLRLTAVHQSGERDVGYGLALGEGDAYLVVAVSPLGYVAIWETDPGAEERVLLPWQPWPHVAPTRNEIWVDLLPGGEMRAWINRELLWQGTPGSPGPKVGIVGQSYGGEAVIVFPQLER